MDVAATADRVIRGASGVAHLASLAREAGLECRRDVTVDALHDGKPVCTVTVPALLAGTAVFEAAPGLPDAVLRARLASLAAALPMPVRFIPSSLS